MIPFTKQDVENWFSAYELKKANPYIRKVTDLKWKDENTLSARTQGRERTPYRQTITLGVDHKGLPQLVSSHCSCYVGSNCKHIAAVLMAESVNHKITHEKQLPKELQDLLDNHDHPLRDFILSLQQSISKTISFPNPTSAPPPTRTPEEIQKQETARYFKQLYGMASRSLEQSAPFYEAGKEFVLWTIVGTDSKVTISPFRVKQLKSGWSSTVNKVSNIEKYLSSYQELPKYLTPFDLIATRMVLSGAARYPAYSENCQLSGQAGLTALKWLLEHQRLFWMPSTTHTLDFFAVEDGGKHPFKLKWKHNKQKQHALTHDLGKEFTQFALIDTQPVSMIARKSEGATYLYTLNTDLPLEFIEQLKTPVYLSESELLDYWQPLYDLFSELPPLPSSKMDQIETHPIRRVLTIGYLMQPNTTPNAIDSPLMAILTFHYADVVFDTTLTSQAQALHKITDKEGNERIIQRDHLAEEEAADRLQEIGLFTPFTNSDNTWIPRPQTSKAKTDSNLSHQQQQTLEWLPYLDDLSKLEKEGWEIILQEPRLSDIDISSGIHVNLIDDDNDFALNAHLQTESGELPILPLLLEWLNQGKPLPKEGNIWIPHPETGRFIQLPVSYLKPILQTITELYDRPLSENGSMRLTGFDVMGLSHEQAIQIQSKRAKKIQNTVSQLAKIDGIPSVSPPEGLQASLRHYQQEGLNWIHFLTENNLGGVLADDMGLGKTVQIIAHLLKQKELGNLTKPALVISPTNVVGNWKSELNKFAPSLKVLRFDGAQRKALEAEIAQSDVILSSYALVQRDVDMWKQNPLHSVIIDEAQYAKNAQSKTAQAIRDLKAEHRLCLTGTPLENNLGELWSLFDFSMSGFLSSADRFKKIYRTPIEQYGDKERQARLGQRVAPFMLRRTKSEVVTELPPKTEIIQRVTLEKDQWQLYSTVRIAMEQRVQELMAEKGLKRSHIEVLDALLKLRQACCDPRLLKIPAAEKVKESAKLETLLEMVEELTQEGRKILIFSQFATMLGLIEEALAKIDVSTTKLTGQTRDRQGAIDRFTSGEVDVFLISLKAGGVGLNLTMADTVIHYDPWWNPAAEAQATDRAYRIGQDKPVFVYKLIVENTVEEKILQMQEKKRALADSLFGDQDALSVWADGDMILSLFSDTANQEDM